MKKILTLFAGLLISSALSAQIVYNVNVCGTISGPANSAPITLQLDYWDNINSTMVTVTTIVNSPLPSSFCFPAYAAVPDTANFAYISGTVSIVGCGPANSFNYSTVISSNDTINVNVQNCNSAGGCSASISASGPVFNAMGTGIAPFTYSWDGGVTFTSNSYYQANAFGTYCVIVMDANGCTASACYNYTGGGCSASISTVPGTNGVLTANSTGTPPFTYIWNTGVSTQTMTVTTPGLYCVTITDNTGCSDTACFNYTGSSSCNAYVFLSNDPITGADILTAYPDSNSFFVTYQWSLNGAPLPNPQTASINPTLAGTYCVVVTYANGCVATQCYAYNGTGPGNVCSVTAIAIEDSLTAGLIYCFAYPTGVAPFTYQWFFSDGATSTLASPTHVFVNNSPNINWVFVTVTDANGCISNYSAAIYMNPPMNNSCAADFYSYGNYQFGNAGEVFFQDYSYAFGNITSYSWSFGDGTSSTLQNPSHTYTVAGNYYVCLTITSSTGCSSTFCVSTYVDPSWWSSNPFQGNCTAGYMVIPGGANSAGLINIINTSQGNNLFYTWNFGNGFITNNPYPYTNFTAAGTYVVCLSITDTVTGCNDTFCDTLTVDSLGNISRDLANGNAGLFVSASPQPNSLLSTSGLELQNNDKLTVSPNPSNGLFNLNIGSAQGSSLVEVSNVNGQIVYSNYVSINKGQKSTSIDLQSLADGSYFVKVIAQNTVETAKILIKK